MVILISGRRIFSISSVGRVLHKGSQRRTYVVEKGVPVFVERILGRGSGLGSMLRPGVDLSRWCRSGWLGACRGRGGVKVL